MYFKVKIATFERFLQFLGKYILGTFYKFLTFISPPCPGLTVDTNFPCSGDLIISSPSLTINTFQIILENFKLFYFVSVFVLTIFVFQSGFLPKNLNWKTTFFKTASNPTWFLPLCILSSLICYVCMLIYFWMNFFINSPAIM